MKKDFINLDNIKKEDLKKIIENQINILIRINK